MCINAFTQSTSRLGGGVTKVLKIPIAHPSDRDELAKSRGYRKKRTHHESQTTPFHVNPPLQRAVNHITAFMPPGAGGETILLQGPSATAGVPVSL